MADKLKEYEERGWVIDQFLHLDLHFPTVVEPAGQPLNGTLQDFSINLEEKQQTADNIYEVLSAAVYRHKKAIQNELVKNLP